MIHRFLNPLLQFHLLILEIQGLEAMSHSARFTSLSVKRDEEVIPYRIKPTMEMISNILLSRDKKIIIYNSTETNYITCSQFPGKRMN